ncbi:lymphocyte activation gene 3 protein [Vanacampus margaritifer]
MLVEYLVSALMMFSMSDAQLELQEVFAESNSQALLPCDCNTSSSAPIIWTKDKQGTVWRQERSGLQFWGSRWLQRSGQQRVGCPRCQLVGGDCGLRISGVREQDGGLYTCKFQSGRRLVTRSLVLRVIKVSFSPAVPVAGVHVSINCTVTPEPQGATVQWRLNNGPFVPSSAPCPLTSRWNVEEKASARLAGYWTCVVAGRSARGRASAALTVRGIVRPSQDGAKVYAAVGSAATLPCVFSRDLNPAQPAWYKLKPGSVWKAAFQSLPSSSSSSSPASQPAWDQSVHLQELVLEDAGTYRCAGIVEGNSLSRQMQLVVAKIDCSAAPKKTIALTCQLTDASEVTRYQWVRVTYDLSGMREVEPIQQGRSLRVSEMSREDGGEWVCRFYGARGLLGNVTQSVTSQLDHVSGSAGVAYTAAVVLGVTALLFLLILILAQTYKNHRRRKRNFQFITLETILHAKFNEQEAREQSPAKKGKGASNLSH